MELTPRNIAHYAEGLRGIQRETYLDSVCEPDSEIRRQVDSLLEIQESQTMDMSDNPEFVVHDKEQLLNKDEWFGPFRIHGLLGRGAMGTVYLAQQQNPKRQVALKVMNAEMMTESRLKRFELETESLAKLRHPGIATIYESGQTQIDGQPHPYFAMEYVQGRELDQYSRALGLRERVELLRTICEAIEHAHLRGVVHRDLKPANIVVDEDGRARVLDFGVAKSLEQDSKVKELVGTVPYMSPEQLRKDTDIDLRTDVYALGVMIFEVLTGKLPHNLSGLSINETIELVSQPVQLNTSGLDNELQAVISKAMCPDRESRYGAASELALDLRRYLDSEPIEAVGGGRLYRGKKFVNRNRALVALSFLAVLVLIAGVVVASYQAARATRGWATAETEREATLKALLQVQAERERALAVNVFVIDMLGSADPSSTLGEELTVREVLDTAAMTIETDFAEFPNVHASVRMALSNTYLGLGQLDEALLHATEMVRVSTESLGDRDPMTADAKRTLAGVLLEFGRFDEAQILLDEALDVVDAQGDAVESAKIRSTMARIHHGAGRHDISLEIWSESERVLSKNLGANHKETLIVMHNRGIALKDIGRLGESEAVMKDVAARRMKTMGPDHPQTLVARDVLASVIQKQGRDQEAVDIFRDVASRRERVLGADHFSTLLSQGNLGAALIRLGELDEAETLTKRALDGHRKRFGEGHAKTLILMGNLAYLLEDQGKVDEAAALYQETIDIRKRASGGADPETWAPINNLAMLLMNNGKADQAEPLFAELMVMCEAMLPANHYYLALFRNNYGECLTKLDRFDDAQDAFDKSHSILVATFGADHARVLKSSGRIEALEVARNQSP